MMQASIVTPVEKAKALLLDNLSDSQREEFLRSEQFTVESGGDNYILKKDITVRGDGTRFCAISPGLPVYDQMLARKLALEKAPDLFFTVANEFPAGGRSFRSFTDLTDDFITYIKRVFLAKGFDERALTISMEQDWSRCGEYRIAVHYGNYGIRQIVDRGHFQQANTIDALAPLIEDMARHMAHQIIFKAGQHA